MTEKKKNLVKSKELKTIDARRSEIQTMSFVMTVKSRTVTIATTKTTKTAAEDVDDFVQSFHDERSSGLL